MFAHVVEQLGKLCCAQDARVILEKPFGNDLASARKLNDVLDLDGEMVGFDGIFSSPFGRISATGRARTEDSVRRPNILSAGKAVGLAARYREKRSPRVSRECNGRESFHSTENRRCFRWGLHAERSPST